MRHIPKWYRDRAEEARTLAGNMNTEDGKAQMIAVADQWDSMAVQAERLIKRLPKGS